MQTATEREVKGEVVQLRPLKPHAYPKSEASVRPYHLWDATANGGRGEPIRYRYFSDKKRAHNAAMLECKWSKKVGTVIEVYDAEHGRTVPMKVAERMCYGYKLGLRSIEFVF